MINMLSSEQLDDPSQMPSVMGKKDASLGLQLSELLKSSEGGSLSARSSESNPMTSTVDMNIDVQVKFHNF